MGTTTIAYQKNTKAIQSKEEAIKAHAELAEHFRKREELYGRIEAAIAELKKNYEPRAAKLTDQIATSASQLRDYAEQHKAEILHSGIKSTKAPTGKYGWQKEKDRIVVQGDEEEIIKSLRKLLKENACVFIKTTEKLQLTELLKNFDMIDGVKGLERKEGTDKFYIDVDGIRLEISQETISARFILKV